ncbi:hypothetical protein EDD18DRAFT_1359684 [Armillaria luteobubalina]|uniref:Uncharacterized protein n=1 Tax=Armillaria luteobubalina TaxID=153913 RepID=A0AA39PPY2_9AGAR|nr:hypothetical protein EDD18DRAFT_1359684 [Armillaria luteobubalina]
MSFIQERPQCPYCLKNFHKNGIGNHKRTCKQRIEQSAIDSQFNLDQNESQAANVECEAINTPRLLFSNQAQSNSSLDSQFEDLHLDSQRNLPSSLSFQPVSSEDEDGNSSNPIINAADEILDLVNPYNPQFQIEYHPSALLDPCILTREEYFQMTALEMTDSFVNNCPWHPFASERDFELAELILRDHPSAYTINNESDLNDAWSKAEHLLTMFKKEELSLQYRDETRLYDVHFRPLWEWTLNLLNDETLSPHFVWDAVKIFQLDEKTNTKMRIFDEPWTGNVLWEVQSSLPPGGKPLAYILYADKTQLSSFGTAKGYPVIARIANLPDAIWNGKDWGGGTVVGWLPVVEDDPKHKGKPTWINFKRVVWHESFQKIIESIEDYSSTGYAFKLPHSGHIIVIYPFILILCADYEEHCMMTLIRGVNSAYPCPVCLVPNAKLQDILEVYIPRTTEEMQELYDRAEDEGEEILDKVSLRNVENVFWSIANSDPYKAVSWDRLHAYHLGVFRHLLNRLLEHLENIPGAEKRHAKVVIDEFINNFPRWKNFTHFTNVTTFDFGDAKKFEHMSKASFPETFHYDTYHFSSNSFLLPILYLELDMYASMDVHTEKSIEEGRQLLQVFEATLKAYTEATDNQNFKNLTSWSIPKVHTQQHLFDDIIAKGATKNYNTKVNESMHGPLKKTYQTQTNFKNVSEQILMTDHRYKIAMQLRQKIDLRQAQMTSVDIEANDSAEAKDGDSAEAEDDDIQNEEIESLDSKAKLHSLQFTSKDPRTFEELETAFHSDPAYERF